MSVHYKFKSAKDYDTITFEGNEISVADLKKEIVNQQKLGKATDFDLVITNAQTKEEFKEEKDYIPKNTSVIVKRVPSTRPMPHYNSKPQAEITNTYTAQPYHSVPNDQKGEAANLNDFVNNNSSYNPVPQSHYRPRYSDNRAPPPNYICHRCSNRGHFIHNCPTNGDPKYDFQKVKKATGIPRAFLKPAEGAAGHDTMMVPGVGTVVMQPNSGDFDKYASAAPSAGRQSNHLPNDVSCPICNNLLRDAVLTPCCATTFCDLCIRRAMFESSTMSCPHCNKPGLDLNNLVVNLKARAQVEKFTRNNVTSPVNKPSNMTPPPMVGQSHKPVSSTESGNYPKDNPNVYTNNPPRTSMRPRPTRPERRTAISSKYEPYSRSQNPHHRSTHPNEPTDVRKDKRQSYHNTSSEWEVPVTED